MFSLDPKTLSLVVGLANLIFALLATLYIFKLKTSNAALEIWRWGRLLAGTGYLANLVSSAAPQVIPPVLGNVLQVLAAGCDIAAYSMLLGQVRWERRLVALVGGAVGGLLLVSVLSSAQHPRLLLFSALGVVFYGVLSFLILRGSGKDWLRKLIGAVDGLLVLVLFLRVGKGLALAPLERFDSDVLTLLLYLALYLVAMINGFGFLLLAKQRDDQELLRALGDLEQADEDRRQLLIMASHEFRTPVALIKASLDSLRFVPDSAKPEIAGRLDNIRRASMRLTDLSNTLLTYDRLHQPGLSNRQPGVDLSLLLQDALKLYPAEYDIRLELPGEPLEVVADPVQIRIAIQNLIDNALEHTGMRGGVLVLLRSTPENVEISVADQGPGVPDAEKARVFEPFRNGRGDLVRGLGLSIVNVIARNHGGSVSVRDNLPQGAVMVLTLPRHR